MAVRDRNRRRGIALLITLMITSLVTASVLTFIRMTHLEAKVAENVYTYAQAEILADAGLQGAMSLLAGDDDDVDSPQDTWAHFADYAAMAAAVFEEGRFSGSIVDLSGKIGVNDLIDVSGDKDLVNEKTSPVMACLAEKVSPDIRIDPLLDWLDRDDEVRRNGAENNYYITRDPSYPCANGPLTTIDQLTLIKDLTPELVYGEKTETETKPGLAEYVTAHSAGTVNVNTAGEEVLLCLHPELTEMDVQTIMEYRAESPFEKLDELKTILTPEVFMDLTFLSVNSSHFKINIVAEFREARVVVEAVVERSQTGDVRLLYYRSG
jgi:general secretion pathway protein K